MGDESAKSAAEGLKKIVAGFLELGRVDKIAIGTNLLMLRGIRRP